MHSDILIIGAGASGLMAAKTLATAGKNVRVLEARNRIGGRIHTTRLAGFSFAVETGAEFIHGNLPLTLNLAREAGLTVLEMEGDTYNVLKGKIESAPLSDNQWVEMMAVLSKLETDITLTEFFRTYFNEEKYSTIRESARKFVEGFDAADPDRVSMYALREEWSHFDEDPQFRIKEGYSKVPELIYEECIRRNVDIVLSQVVSKIKWNEEHVEVITNEERKFTAGKIIVTVPLGVLISERITFEPAIQHHIVSAKKLGYGGVIKFLAEFNHPIWEDDVSSHRYMPKAGFLFSDASVPTWWTQLPDNKPVLTGWLAGPTAEKWHSQYDDLKVNGISSLAYLLGCDEKQLQASLKSMEVVNWLDDPFSLGAYSYTTPETESAKKILNAPISNTVYFAGEALNEGKEMGTVEAALKSGKAVAEKIITETNISP
jgi:monoamine oxidase